MDSRIPSFKEALHSAGDAEVLEQPLVAVSSTLRVGATAGTLRLGFSLGLAVGW